MPSFSPSSPHVSANELGVFTANPTGRRRIVDQIKNPRIGIVARYSKVLSSISSCISDQGFTEEAVTEALKKLEEAKFSNKLWPIVRDRNITVMRRFRNICEKASPPAGEHRRLYRGQYFEWEGVQISVLPDIITENKELGYFAYTKFRFSDNKYTWDASEYVLLLLQKFAKTQEKKTGLKFDMNKTKLVDCSAMQVFEGHNIASHREKNLKKALTEFSLLWPTVPFKPKNKPR